LGNPHLEGNGWSLVQAMAPFAAAAAMARSSGRSAIRDWFEDRGFPFHSREGSGLNPPRIVPATTSRPNVALTMPGNRTHANQRHPAWGHTWQDHGSQRSVPWHRNRANGLQNSWTDPTTDPQQGFWTNNQQAAAHILSQNLNVGYNVIPIPQGMGRVVFPDGRV